MTTKTRTATVAALSLNGGEASVLEAALRYYIDTIFNPDLEEEPDIDTAADIRTAETLHRRLRKSIERHGYRLTVR